MSPRLKQIIGLSIFISASLSLLPPSVYARKAGMIQIKGSDTMVNLGQMWAEEYMNKYPDRIVAVTGGGSGTGIAAAIAGTCDIAQSSRNMTDPEKADAEKNGHPIQETLVAYDGIAVVVNHANPLSKITIAQLSDIFTGKITRWSELGGTDEQIIVLSRDRNSGTHIFFLEHVLRNGNAKGPEEFAPSVLMMPSSQAIVQEVKSSSGAIGYIGLGYVSQDLKVLPVAQSDQEAYEVPSLETVQANTYKISRPLFFYTPRDAGPAILEFIDYALSPEGQEIVKTADFVPMVKKA